MTDATGGDRSVPHPDEGRVAEVPHFDVEVGTSAVSMPSIIAISNLDVSPWLLLLLLLSLLLSWLLTNIVVCISTCC